MSVLDDKKYPGYKPSFDIRRALRYRVQKEDDATVSDFDLPTELVAASSILATDLLDRRNRILDRVKSFSQALSDCVDRAFPGAIKAYEDAVKNDDRRAIAEFEDRQCVDLSGSIQAELYVVCKNIERAVTKMGPYITDFISPVKPAEGVELREVETNYYSDLAYMEHTQSGSLNRLALAYEAQLKYQVSRRLDYFTEIIDEAESIVQEGYSDLCDNNPAEMAERLVTLGSEGLDSLAKVLETTHLLLANDGIDLNNHNRVLDCEETMSILRNSLSSLTELRLQDSQIVVQWLNKLNLEEENTSIYNLANHLLKGLNAIDQALDTTILDLAKSQETEYLNLKKKLDNIRQRKQVRQLLNVIKKTKDIINNSETQEEAHQRVNTLISDLAMKSDICM